MLTLGPTTITGVEFTIDPSTVQEPALFDRVILANHSQYLIQLRNGRLQHWLHPFMADIFEFDSHTQIVADPMLMDLVIPGAAQHFTATFLMPGEDQDAGAAYPCAMSVYVSPPLPSPEYWSMGKTGIALTNVEVMQTLNIVEGWGSASSSADHYTVPASKQLVIANIQLHGRPNAVPLLFEMRLRSGSTTAAALMLSVSSQPSQQIGAPTTGVVPGMIQTPFFGTRAMTIPAAGTIGVGALHGGGGAGSVDFFMVGTIENTT